jgi:hypothetical protein
MVRSLLWKDQSSDFNLVDLCTFGVLILDGKY